LAVSSRQKVQEHFEKLTHKYPNRIFTTDILFPFKIKGVTHCLSNLSDY